MEIHVLNLKRQPHRKKKFIEYNSKCVDKINFIEAIDGNMIGEREIKDMKEKNLLKGNSEVMNKYIIANAMSQRKLWLKCIETNKNIFFFEDDAVLREDFVEQYNSCIQRWPPDWDFLLLGLNLDSIIDFDFFPGIEHIKGGFSNNFLTDEKLKKFQKYKHPTSGYKLRNAFGVPGYVITPSGATKLLELCFPLEEKLLFVPALRRNIITYTLDIIINSHFPSINPYICFPPIVITPNDKKKSSCTWRDAS